MFQRGWSDAPLAWACQWKVISVLAVFGIVLGAWYMLWLIERLFFGRLKEPGHHGSGGHDEPVHDLSLREMAALVPLLVFVFWIGLTPGRFLDPMTKDLNKVSEAVGKSYDRAYALPVVVAESAPETTEIKIAAGDVTRGK
jgi:NADH-quinone oxidoreductase subunit M